ncbi:universal stress protein [Mesorhizobium sp.]|uniref:universal stress protein n=1 Tax=Mesorhizobium sp. TaxID=1871066 RepID=UPI000FE39D87|nr:universal stress protein [Mesorhizobium sp.]RWO02339.1 MAG: universal stress protein [Mesorhizobium sp.]
MYKHILISTDGSDVAQRGVDHGLSLAKSLDAKVTVITVTEPFPFHASAAGGGWVPLPGDISGYEEGQKKAAEKLLVMVRESAARIGVSADVLHVPDARPAEAIVDAAKAQECSLIVMASHGRRGLGRLLLGSQTSEVLAHSPVPVLVVR